MRVSVSTSLWYNHDISQAISSNHVINFAKTVNQVNGTLDEVRNDYCSLEVSSKTCERVYLFIDIMWVSKLLT